MALSLLTLLLLGHFQLDFAWAVSSHSPQDLLAYPKYSVTLADWHSAITNASAVHILHHQSSHPGSFPDHQHASDDVAIVADTQSIDHDQQPRFRQRLMRTSSGKAFLCKVPGLPQPIIRSTKPSPSLPAVGSGQTDQDHAQRIEELQKIESEGLKRGLELISSLKDRCIYTRLGWFTYSFCYGKGEIRQFHAVSAPGQHFPREDPNQDVYTLGFHVDHPHNPHHQARLDRTLPASTAMAAEGQLTSLGRNRFSSNPSPAMGLSDVLREESVMRSEGSWERDEFEQKRYLVQRWEGGTICDMTGKPRAVEVQFHCSTVATDHIALLRETSICEYLVIIHTPRLCSERLFLDGGGRKTLNGGEELSPIECQPVLSEEVIAQLKAKEAVRKEKKAAEQAEKVKLIEEQRVRPKSPASSEPEAGEQAPEQVPNETEDVQWDEATDVIEEQPSTDSLSQTAHDTQATQDSRSLDNEASDTDQPEREKKPEAGVKGKSRGKKDQASPNVFEVDPITVYFDADTGQVYLDNSNGAAGQARRAGDNRGNHNARARTTADQARETGGEDQAGQNGSTDDLEDLAKALKESLGALLRDFRGNQAGAPRRVNRGPAESGPGSLATLIAALKETGSLSRLRQRETDAGGAQRSADSPRHAQQAGEFRSRKGRMSEDHVKLLKVYEGDFDGTVDTDEETDGQKTPKVT